MRNYAELYGRIKELPSLLKSYQPDYSVDNLLDEMTKDLEKSWSPKFPISDRFLEQNLCDVSALLDKLFAYRRDINELEADRVRAGLAYMATMAAADAEAQLEIARAGHQRDEIEAAATVRAQVIKDSVSAMESRHGIDGGALNFSQRREKIEARMAIDLFSAYSRSQAIISGLSRLGYGSGLDFPTTDVRLYAKFDGARHLDDWLQWHQQTLDLVEFAQQSQVIGEVNLALGMKGRYQTSISDPAGRLLMDTVAVPVENLMETIKSDQGLILKLLPNSPGWPFNEISGTIGLRAVGITVSIPEAVSRNWVYGATILPPDRDVPILIGNVPLLSGGPHWVEDPSIYNLGPRGDWKISLNSNPLHDSDISDDTRVYRDRWPIRDLQLHLKFVSIRPLSALATASRTHRDFHDPRGD